ncbi:patatin-like phospholipase domain-containing protein 2 isoform X2 [Takifugu rubripes]|uniref:patatin-like phospholipase domain-containing protein 2 isoform X2 n=1 Tax=Takifugu rubripes TaxID=31033 RepID=UPI0011458DBD|nr:patatin-like phospholipase domain-containing protein 2 isoform X2 [Takifugu rubripes]
MLDLERDWSLSFAGCGFMGIYYVGVNSCILERCPRLIRDASRIYGASAGALMAAVMSAGVPLEKCCSDLMSMARRARSHPLGPLHPSFNLLQMVKDSLLSNLPENAHILVSGRLCVSLTRVPDGKNVLVSEFRSRDELVEALICSCFVPLYCGVVPPTYRGVHYVDGAASDNLPRCCTKNTVTISAYADLISSECPMRNLEMVATKPCCKEVTESNKKNPVQNRHQWLDPQLIEKLPVPIKRVLCESCRETQSSAGLLSHMMKLPKKMTSFLQLPSLPPIESAYSLAQRLVQWIPGVHREVSWLYSVGGDNSRQAQTTTMEDSGREPVVRRWKSLPSDLNLWDHLLLPLTPADTPTSTPSFTWNTSNEPEKQTLTPPPTPTDNPAPGTG